MTQSEGSQELLEQVFFTCMRLKRFRLEPLHTPLAGTEFHILSILRKHREKQPKQIGVYASVLAAMLEVSRPAISKQLQRMEEMGWIERVTDPESRRNTYVRLLPVGEQVCEEQKRLIDDFWECVFQRAGVETVRKMIEGVGGVLDAAQEELEDRKNTKEEHAK